MSAYHTSVMPAETLDALQIREAGTYLDGTCGGAGHAELIAKRLGQEGRLYCFDRDEDAITEAAKRLKPYGEIIRLFHENYKDAVTILKAEGVGSLDGILLDLGVSSHQIDDSSRGFSYMQDAPLDMRMDRRQNVTAYDLVNNAPAGELKRIFKEYGEERFAAQIADRIAAQRETRSIDTTFALNEIIYASVPKAARAKGSHPSKRVFQALRIACNEELSGLDACLDDMIDFLSPGGRLAVITFHSLEDRIVKQCFQKNENPCVCPPSFPVCTCGRASKGKITPRKAICPTEAETKQNKRAKSARLRIFEKTRED